MGLVVRRVRLADVTAVLVDEAKVSVARANGGEVSMYAWRKGPLDALLRAPLAASDIGHAIASAVALARAAEHPEAGAGRRAAGWPGPYARPHPVPARHRAARRRGRAGDRRRAGRPRPLAQPRADRAGVILALALGVSGLLYLLVALWILLTGRAPRTTVTR